VYWPGNGQLLGNNSTSIDATTGKPVYQDATVYHEKNEYDNKINATLISEVSPFIIDSAEKEILSGAASDKGTFEQFFELMNANPSSRKYKDFFTTIKNTGDDIYSPGKDLGINHCFLEAYNSWDVMGSADRNGSWYLNDDQETKNGQVGQLCKRIIEVMDEYYKDPQGNPNWEGDTSKRVVLVSFSNGSNVAASFLANPNLPSHDGVYNSITLRNHVRKWICASSAMGTTQKRRE
jgi:hypothetical protein